jgi:hypothetical protein
MNAGGKLTTHHQTEMHPTENVLLTLTKNSEKENNAISNLAFNRTTIQS